MKRVVLCVALMLATAGAASATAVQTAAARFGLIGRWAPDCSSGPSNNNEYAVYALAGDGSVSLVYDSGPDVEPNRYRWTDGSIQPNGDLRMDGVFFGNGLAQHDRLRKNRRGQLTTWSNVDGSGRVLVVDGHFPSGGGPGWMTKCSR